MFEGLYNQWVWVLLLATIYCSFVCSFGLTFRFLYGMAWEYT